MRFFFYKFLKFGLVGLSGVIVDFAITWICKEKLRVQKFVANSIGFTVAASGNYLLNRWWTFQSHNQKVIQEYLGFIAVSVIGLVINNAILWYLHGRCKINFYLAKLLAIGITTIWNFLANYFITFGAR